MTNLCPTCALPAIRTRRLDAKDRWWCIRGHEWSTKENP